MLWLLAMLLLSTSTSALLLPSLPLPEPSSEAALAAYVGAFSATHVGLSAVNKFILYGFLAPDVVQSAQVLNRTAAAASLVRFERIDRSIDEQVYLQICTTLLHCIICPAGTACSVGSAEPAYCLPGAYGASPGQFTCDLCEPGTFANVCSLKASA